MNWRRIFGLKKPRPQAGPSAAMLRSDTAMADADKANEAQREGREILRRTNALIIGAISATRANPAQANNHR